MDFRNVQITIVDQYNFDESVVEFVIRENGENVAVFGSYDEAVSFADDSAEFGDEIRDWVSGDAIREEEVREAVEAWLASVQYELS